MIRENQVRLLIMLLRTSHYNMSSNCNNCAVVITSHYEIQGQYETLCERSE